MLSTACVRAARYSAPAARFPSTARHRPDRRRGVCRVFPDMPTPPATIHTPVHVVETSLGIVDDVRLLRHLGLRFGPEDSFVEAHFGPSDAGSFHEGFLKFGEGKVAESEYLEEFSVGETNLTKEQALDWCRNWAKDKIYVTVGQNCWSMVHEFLTTHEGCELTDELKFKEESVNGASQTLMNLVERVADEDDRPPEEVMQELMEHPRPTLKRIFTAERIMEVTGVSGLVDNAVEQSKEKLETMKGLREKISLEEVQDQASKTEALKKLRAQVASIFGSSDDPEPEPEST